MSHLNFKTGFESLTHPSFSASEARGGLLQVANVLRTCVKRRELTPSLAVEISALHLDAPLAVEEPDRAAVLATVLELDAMACDAALITRVGTLDAPLLTAERRSRAWVVRFGKLVGILPRGASPASRSHVSLPRPTAFRRV